MKEVTLYGGTIDSCLKDLREMAAADKSGEYWKSRGASSYDVSGFVESKPAGERLLRMVKYILETDEPKTLLDYREFEPNWIQLKFSAEEFDVEKLDQMARDNGDVLTEAIVRLCVKAKVD